MVLILLIRMKYLSLEEAKTQKELEGYIWLKRQTRKHFTKATTHRQRDRAIDAARYCIMMVLENPNRELLFILKTCISI